MVATARRLESQFRLLPAAVPALVPALPPVELVASEAVKRLRGGLEARISANLTSGTELIRALEQRRREEIVPTAIEAIDNLLDGGLPRGKLTEIAGRGARLSIVVATIASATSIGEAAALIDLGDAFDPQLGQAADIDLRRMLWVRPKTLKQAVGAAEMLVAAGFQLVVLDVGPPPRRSAPAESGRYIGRVPDAAWVRLARAAESHGAALLISAPYALTGTKSEAMLCTEASRGRWSSGLLTAVETRVRLEKHRRKRPGENASLVFTTAEAISEQRAAGGERESLSIYSPLAASRSL